MICSAIYAKVLVTFFQSQAESLPKLLKPQTRAVILTSASNVCGTLMPLRETGKFCAAHGLRFITDSSQTAGTWPIHMEEMHIDALAFTGPKGLSGPQGIGGFLLRQDMASRIEPGTLNLPGILGLSAALHWIEETGMDSIRAHELALAGHFLNGLREIPGIRIIGKQDMQGRTGTVSLQTVSKDIAQAAFELDEAYGIMTRAGLHCAPSAHKTLGTYPAGTIRFSFGWHNTLQDADDALAALAEIA